MDVRTRTEEIERLTLSPWATFSDASRGRVRPEEQDPIRPVFQRDRDRIIHCKAFRRLKQKTQVFLSPEGDLYRTRLTHTLEVSQIARTIARALRLNEDLTEAISLAHDLGHTPFGHAGERALDKIMLSNLKKYQLILASNSPRRKELMSGLGVEYVVRTLPDVDESYPETLVGAAIPEYISRKKADAYRSMMKPGELLITADTIVWLEGKVLGKPEGREGAVEMLRALSGKSHQVFTGVCLTTTEWQKSFTAASDVLFDVLSEDEIQYYVDRYQPMDKAGAYGVQEWIGYIGVKSISGSFYNIMGLPIQKLYGELKKL